MTEQSRLDHLLDRARRGVILPAEGEQLAGLVATLETDVDNCRTRYATQADNALHLLEVAGTRVIELEAEVARLGAGQCTCSLAMCEQHHTQPVATCPYPRCLAAQKREAEQHPFEQNPAAPASIHVCRCGKWPDHHIHTSNTTTCGCDACRATETDHA